MLRIKELRDAHDPPLAQETLAQLAGISVRTVVRSEAKGTASMKTLQRIAGVLGVKVDDLFPDPERAA